MAKEGVVKFIDLSARKLEQPVQNADGSRRFGGHSMRVSGAQWLARLGVPVPLIRSLARWESDTVLRYIKDAHHDDLAGSVIRLLRSKEDVIGGHDLQAARDDFAAQCDVRDSALRKELEVVKDDLHRVAQVFEQGMIENQHVEYRLFQQRIEKLEHDLAELASAVREVATPAAPMQAECPEFVLNLITGAMHRVGGPGIVGAADNWRSLSGWRYGRSSAYRFSGNPGALAWCGKCIDLPPLGGRDSAAPRG